MKESPSHPTEQFESTANFPPLTRTEDEIVFEALKATVGLLRLATPGNQATADTVHLLEVLLEARAGMKVEAMVVALDRRLSRLESVSQMRHALGS